MKKILLISFTISLTACQKEKMNEDFNFGYDYAGLNVGKYIIYDVDSIVYDDFYPPVKIDTFQFQIKELVDSKFIDATGTEAYKIIRYKRTNDTTDWVLQDVWSCKLTKNTYEVVEENIRYIKLAFPIKVNKTWNGNSMNNLEEWDYQYTFLHQNETIGDISFDSVATVLQFDDEDKILTQRDFSEEKYAACIGLVYRKNIAIDKKYNPQLSWYWAKGIEYTMTLNSYSN